MDTIQDFSTPAGKSYLARLATLPPGQYRVSVVRYRRRRSDEQNRYYWGVVIPCITAGLHEAWGRELAPLQVHELMKSMFLSEEVINPDTGEVHRLPRLSSAKLNLDQFGQYLEQIMHFAAESLSVVIPDPSFSPQPKPPTTPTVGASAN
jgi:hypothetical protein